MGVSWGPSPSPLATFSLRPARDAATAPRRGSSARSFWPALTGTRTQPTELVESEDARMPTHCEAAVTGRPVIRNQEKDPVPPPRPGSR